MDGIEQFLYTWIFLHVLTSQMVSSFTKAAVFYGTLFFHLFFQIWEQRDGWREGPGCFWVDVESR